MCKMKVTVVIPNYNGMRFLKTCLDSLRLQRFKDFETLIVDNASEDGSCEYIQENYPEVKLLKNEKNLGFSGAVNIGIEMSETEYVILLNNDTEAASDFVGELVNAIEESDDIFSVSSKMINFNDREIMDDAGDLYSIVGWGFQRGVGKSSSLYKKTKDVFSACAGAAIYRKKIFNEIGMFDLSHFAYLEDMDLGYRAKIQGYRNVYCPTAVVYHVGSGTSGSRYNSFKVRLSSRNNIYMIYKNMPWPQIILNMPFLTVGFVTKYFFFKKIGFGRDYAEGIKEGITKLHKLKKVEYNPDNLKNYIKIEKEMILGMIIYIKDYADRHLD